MFDTQQKPLHQKIIDVIFDTISLEFGEKSIIEDIQETDPKKLFQKLCDLDELFRQHSWHLTTDISASDLANMMEAMKLFEKNLNAVLEKGDFSISEYAVKELIGAVKYGKDPYFKTIDKIFQIVNGNRRGNVQLTAITNSKIKPLYEVRITQKARVFYTINPNKILGFDFEHRRDDHIDVIARIEGRV